MLQCLLPSAGAQLQAGCAHFVVGVIEVLLTSNAFRAEKSCSPALFFARLQDNVELHSGS
jgi:hypothetical protein